MRDKHKKYSKGSHTTSELIRIHNPNIYKILQWLETKLKPSEVIDIHYWASEWLYIIVEDRNIKEYIVNMRMGFTVNMSKDIVMYNNDKSDNHWGGNCFVRANKWKTNLRKYLGNQYNEHTFHIYKDPRPLIKSD